MLTVVWPSHRTNIPGSQTMLVSIFVMASVSDENRFKDPAYLKTLTPTDFVVQMSKPLWVIPSSIPLPWDLLTTYRPNNTFAPGFGAQMTLSPNIFFVNTSYFHIVARCQNCAVQGNQPPSIFREQILELTFVNSKGVPHYLDNSTHSAIYFWAGSETTPFTFNAARARFNNYTKMLEIAGLSNISS